MLAVTFGEFQSSARAAFRERDACSKLFCTLAELLMERRYLSFCGVLADDPRCPELDTTIINIFYWTR